MATKVRILDADIENRPLAYLGADYTTAEITAIAACFVDEPKSMRVWLLGKDDPKTMLVYFKALYDAADMVTGHYIRAHDLPMINGAMLEYHMEPLGPKLVCDTKMDLVRRKDLSASQENLSAMLGLKTTKSHMSNQAWREANRLTDAGLKLTAQRCIGDVIQHMALRKRLVELDYLHSPRVWRP